MTRLLSAAGVAVYAFALSTAALPEQEAGSGFGFLVTTAVAAEAQAEDTDSVAATSGQPAEEAAEPVRPLGTAAAPVWHPDRDGMLTAEAPAPSPLDVLNPL